MNNQLLESLKKRFGERFKDLFEHNIDNPEKLLDDLFDQISKFMGEEAKPIILMTGKTGTGKSSVLNTILGENVFEVGIKPTTKEFSELHCNIGKDVIVVDAPGFCDPSPQNTLIIEHKDGKKEELPYDEALMVYAKEKANMILLVLKCDDRALEPEMEFLKKWQQFSSEDDYLKELPFLVVINQIDKMKPVRQWDPENLNLYNPITEKEKNIRAYFDWVISLEAFKQLFKNDRIVLFSAGENIEEAYNVDVLKNKLYELFPDSLKTAFARACNLLDREADRIIKYYTVSAGAISAGNILPAPDFVFLSSLQIAMTLHLGSLYGKQITKQIAVSILSPILGSLAGRFAVQALVSFFPGIKNVVGPALATTITFTIGKTVKKVLASGLPLTVENIKNASQNIKIDETEIKQFC